jgi:hypothetical protein
VTIVTFLKVGDADGVVTDSDTIVSFTPDPKGADKKIYKLKGNDPRAFDSVVLQVLFSDNVDIKLTSRTLPNNNRYYMMSFSVHTDTAREIYTFLVDQRGFGEQSA